MRALARVRVAAAVVVGLALVVGLFVLAYRQDGFIRDTILTATRPPHTPTKYLFYVAVALVALATPLGLAEWRAERRFVRMERELRAARPADAVTRYEGEEGRGFLFDGPGGRTLLLEPVGGIGAPRLVELPGLPPEAAEPPAEVHAAPPPTPDGGGEFR